MMKRTQTLTKFILAFLPLFVASLSGCEEDELLASGDDIEVAEREQPLAALSSRLYEKKELSVCYDTAGFGTQKGWIENAIDRTWNNPRESSLEFSGWGLCTSSGADIEVKIKDEAGRSFQRRYPDGHNKIVLYLRWLSETTEVEHVRSRWSVEHTSIHEFGHAIGFMHEHNREENDDDRYCSEENQGSDPNNSFTPYDNGSVMSYCSNSQFTSWDSDGFRRAYGFPDAWDSESGWCNNHNGHYHTGDFNSDGRADALCHGTGGELWVDYADASGRFGGTDWVVDNGWCPHRLANLFVGDANGDGRDDLICHAENGSIYLDYADSSGEFHGTDYSFDGSWCPHRLGEIHIGDFNGDGRDDLLCQADTGRAYLDYADSSGEYRGTDWSRSSGWCGHTGSALHVGDFSGDGRSDILCHDDEGRIWVDLADAGGHFDSTDSSSRGGWCPGSGVQVHVGDFDGNGRDDLLCHREWDGYKYIDFANSKGEFLGTNWHGLAGRLCDEDDPGFLLTPGTLSSYAATLQEVDLGLHIADFNGDGRADMLCHDEDSGKRRVQYPTKFVYISDGAYQSRPL